MNTRVFKHIHLSRKQQETMRLNLKCAKRSIDWSHSLAHMAEDLEWLAVRQSRRTMMSTGDQPSDNKCLLSLLPTRDKLYSVCRASVLTTSAPIS